MIQIIKNGNEDKKVVKKRILFNNKITCPSCDCEFQFDYEDLTFQAIPCAPYASYFVECPWCSCRTLIPTTEEEVL